MIPITEIRWDIWRSPKWVTIHAIHLPTNTVVTGTSEEYKTRSEHKIREALIDQLDKLVNG